MKAELIDRMGTDLTVVNAARVSFDKESSWGQEIIDPSDGDYGQGGVFYATRKSLSGKDRGLLKYLANHNHWTPFSHVQITMRETVPIFVARQRLKHMVGFTYNEVSRRYVHDEPHFYEPGVWRGAPENAKQGSSDTIIEKINLWDGVVGWSPDSYFVDEVVHNWNRQAEWLYKSMVDGGIAPEQARMVLPQSMYTSYYVTGSLAAWARAYKLRSEESAQYEIRELATYWQQIIGDIEELKYSWGALTNVSSI